MMATTSLKLPDALRARIAKLSEASGKSPHLLMVEAIAAQTERMEEERAFINRALAAKMHVDATGKAYAADEVHEYIRAKLQSSHPVKPIAKPYK